MRPEDREMKQWSLHIAGLLIALSALMGTALAQQPYWIRHYTPGDTAKAMVVDGGGNVYVTGQGWQFGTGNDYVTVMYDRNGNMVWGQRYSGMGQPADDIANGIALDPAGNVIVTGTLTVAQLGYWGSAYGTVKYYLNGAQAWVRRYFGPQTYYSVDFANAIATDNLGNIYVTGGSRADFSAEDIATVSYNPNGIERWVRRVQGDGFSQDSGYAIATTPRTNEIYVAGKQGSYGTLIKYNSSGSQLWTTVETAWQGYFSSMVVDTQGNVYVSGLQAGATANYVVIKYNSSGIRQWLRAYDGGGSDYATAVQVDWEGNVYVTGYSQGAGTGYDYVTIKYDRNGNQQWLRRYDFGDDRAAAMAVWLLTGDVYVTGKSANKIATVHYNTNGDLMWVRRYEHRDGGAIGVALIETLEGQDVYVAGSTQSDFTIIKYPSCYIAGDVNADCCVDDSDLLAVLFAFGESNIDLSEDLNNDGAVDDADLLMVLFHFGNGC
ncbi:MAG: hypothetical protein KatS3mg019_1396 [Fimbriimonadales bacterium]|nr:MAG: hypothetical protein KatS3mg019_1396 [Fimbriimonadales bacterium]